MKQNVGMDRSRRMLAVAAIAVSGAGRMRGWADQSGILALSDAG